MNDVLAMFRHTLETEGKIKGTPDSCTINRAMELCCDVYQLGKEEHDWEKVRNQAAVSAMQGMLSNSFDHELMTPDNVAKQSVKYADALILELRKSAT